MADEKILKDEIFDDEELEGVAGGTAKESVDDRAKLKSLGMYNFDKSKGFAASLKDGFDALGKKIGLDLNVKSNLSSASNTENVYKIGAQEVPRDEFWSIVNETHSASK